MLSIYFYDGQKKNLRRLFVVERIFLSDKKSQILNGINCWLFKEERKIPWLISGTGSVSSFLNAEVRLVEGGGGKRGGSSRLFPLEKLSSEK